MRKALLYQINSGSDEDKYLKLGGGKHATRTDDIDRTSAHRRLHAWEASLIIAICKIII